MPRAMSTKCWKIGLNAHLLSRQLGYRRAGIHHYIEQVLCHLPADEQLAYTIFTHSTPEVVEQLPHQLNRSWWPTSHPAGRIVWEQVALPLLALQEGVDVLHGLAFVTPWATRKPTVVTVYDLSFIHYPESFPKAQRLYLQSQTGRSCRQAQHIITISEASKQDICHHFGIAPEKITVIYPGVDPIFRPLPEAQKQAFRQNKQLPGRFILHVGTLQPRKNILVLLHALAQLNQPEIHLVIVGGKGWFYEQIFQTVQQLGLLTQVHFPGYVADEELPFWYNCADGLVFPSVYEGFGMPIAQALACATPVIASKSSAMPEVGGQVALYFDPHDVSDLVRQLQQLLNDVSWSQQVAQKAPAQAQQFSWPTAGRQTAGVYRQLLGLSPL